MLNKVIIQHYMPVRNT